MNCAAFAESLLESELFGHEKGAFTGAVARHAGAFERARGGKLLLDEIGDAPPAVQVKLLRVQEDRQIMRVGGQESFKIDVRLTLATNRDLDARIAAGAFRQDLLYCLEAYAWPGNVRELRNVVEAAVVTAPGEMLEAARLRRDGPAASAPATPGAGPSRPA